jgi:hypothetical protein
MAIEYAGQGGPGDNEDMQDQGMDESQEGETTDIPLSMLPDPDVQPKDRIILEVVSNNKDSGTATCKYYDDKNQSGGGISDAAKKFEE